MDVLDSLSASMVRLNWIGLLGEIEMRLYHLLERVFQSEILQEQK